MIEKLEGSTVLEIIRKLPEQSKYDCKSDLILHTDDQKSELVKDVTAIANAHGRETGYLFYGVDLRQADPVVGLKRHYDDATLQQMVNSKLEKPVSFVYYETHTGDHSVGVVVIPPSDTRPHIMKATFGKAREGQIPIRRGSSTTWANWDDLQLMYGSQTGRRAEENDIAQLLRRASGPESHIGPLAVEVWQLASKALGPDQVDWLRQEVAGFKEEDGVPIPDYRVVPGYASVYKINPQSLTFHNLDTIHAAEPDNFAPVKLGVGTSLPQLDDLVNSDGFDKSIFIASKQMETTSGEMAEGYIYVKPSDIRAMLAQIKQKIIDVILRVQSEHAS